jgi:hypothetical protein
MIIYSIFVMFIQKKTVTRKPSCPPQYFDKKSRPDVESGRLFCQ